MKISTHPCSFGHMGIASHNDLLLYLELSDDKNLSLQQIFRSAREHSKSGNTTISGSNNSIFAEEIRKVVDGESALNIQINLIGTNFQKQVWQACQQIPSGKTASYKEIAEMIGKPKAVRAVGSALGFNPIAIIVPCHRIIRSDGKHGDYKWGNKIRETLLSREIK